MKSHQLKVKAGVRLALCCVLTLLLAHCGSSTGTSSGSSGGTTTGGTTSGGADPGTDADSAATSGSTSSVMTSAGSAAGGSASTGAQTLVRARVAAQHLARTSRGATVSGSETMAEESESCGDGGEFTFGGTFSYTYDDMVGFPIEAVGDIDIGFVECAESVTVTASDGECAIALVIDGDVAAAFTLAMSDATGYDLTLDMTTPSALTVDVNGDTHTFEMNVSLVMDENANGAYAGTMTIDGEDYDAAEIDDIVYSDFTMADLGC